MQQHSWPGKPTRLRTDSLQARPTSDSRLARQSRLRTNSDLRDRRGFTFRTTLKSNVSAMSVRCDQFVPNLHSSNLLMLVFLRFARVPTRIMHAGITTVNIFNHCATMHVSAFPRGRYSCDVVIRPRAKKYHVESLGCRCQIADYERQSQVEDPCQRGRWRG